LFAFVEQVLGHILHATDDGDREDGSLLRGGRHGASYRMAGPNVGRKVIIGSASEPSEISQASLTTTPPPARHDVHRK